MPSNVRNSVLLPLIRIHGAVPGPPVFGPLACRNNQQLDGHKLQLGTSVRDGETCDESVMVSFGLASPYMACEMVLTVASSDRIGCHRLLQLRSGRLTL